MKPPQKIVGPAICRHGWNIATAQKLREVLDCGPDASGPLFIRRTDDAKAPEDWRSPRRYRAGHTQQLSGPGFTAMSPNNFKN